jgi:hypothetical protein
MIAPPGCVTRRRARIVRRTRGSLVREAAHHLRRLHHKANKFRSRHSLSRLNINASDHGYRQLTQT